MPPFPTLIKMPKRIAVGLINFVRNMLVNVFIISLSCLSKVLCISYLYTTALVCLSTPFVQIALFCDFLLKKARINFGLLPFINNPKPIKL